MSPAFPSANVMNVPLVISVVPSFWYSVPSLMPVILKCVTSTPSAQRLRDHQPTVDGASSLVVAVVTDGVSATGLIIRLAVSVAVEKPSRRRCGGVGCNAPPVPLV